MSAATASDAMVPFKSPKRFLGDLDATIAAKVIASATDIALIVDHGVIKDVALGNEELSREGYYESWRGRRWIETVTAESRPKIDDLLRGASSHSAHWRQVNHPSHSGADIPIKYTAVPTSNEGRLVALGRDLRAVSSLQQRLVEAHQELERDYSRLRQTESRYQILFRSISEAVMVADGATLAIEEANPAAARFAGLPIEKLIGTSVSDLFEAKSRRAVDSALSAALSSGRAEELSARLNGGAECSLFASAYRQENATHIVVRLAPPTGRTNAPQPRSQFIGVLEALPDGLVVTAPDLRIIAANRAFLDLSHLTSEHETLGEPLVQFLGRSGTELNVLVSNLKGNGAVRNFATVMRDRYGGTEDVEVSAVSAPRGDSIVYGFSVRGVAKRLKSGPRIGRELPNSVDQLTGLVGRVALKDIVRESTDLIEKLCIEAALELTRDNRASAAEVLGLSRQGLYSKLKRFGMGELD